MSSKRANQEVCLTHAKQPLTVGNPFKSAKKADIAIYAYSMHVHKISAICGYVKSDSKYGVLFIGYFAAIFAMSGYILNV